MKKPALIETAVRLFPDKEFETATTRIAIKGHVTGRLYYSPLNSKENILNHIHRTGLGPYIFCIETLEKTSQIPGAQSLDLDYFKKGEF